MAKPKSSYNRYKPSSRSQTEWVHGREVKIPRSENIRGGDMVRAYKGMLDSASSRGIHQDGWINAFTGIGDPLRDKMNIGNSGFSYNVISQQDAETLWRGSDIAAKAVEKVPEEITRQGFRLKIQGDDDRAVTEEAESIAEEMDFEGKAKEAMEYSRAYGGAGIFLGADDGQKDLTKPLDMTRIKTFRWMNTLTPLELFPRIWYGDPHAPKYGVPMIYRLQRFVFGGAVETGFSEKIFEMPLIHESRVIRVDGILVSRRMMRERNGWGDSVFARIMQVISDFEQAYHGAAILSSDFAQAVLKLKNLAELVSSQDQGDVAARAQLVDMSRSICRAIIIDKEEEFERKATPVSGLSDLLMSVAYRLGAALDMPVSLLLGQSPGAGMGGSSGGESETRWFYDRMQVIQRRKYKPILKRMFQILFNSKDGPTNGKEPENWSIDFNPLWQLSDGEQADRRLKIAQADAVYLSSQVVSPEEVAASRFGGDQYNGDSITIDLESRAQIQTLAPEDPRPGPVEGVARPPTPVPTGELGNKDPQGGAQAPSGSGALGFRENPPNPGSTDGEPS
jgi:uncharacterized protein